MSRHRLTRLGPDNHWWFTRVYLPTVIGIFVAVGILFLVMVATGTAR